MTLVQVNVDEFFIDSMCWNRNCCLCGLSIFENNENASGIIDERHGQRLDTTELTEVLMDLLDGQLEIEQILISVWMVLLHFSFERHNIKE